MMHGIRIFVFSALLLAFAAGNGAAVELTVAYTANTSGKLSGCTCPGDRYGGLAERATLVKQLRKKETRMLLLDAGSMVSLFGDFDARAAVVMKLMNLMGYNAAGIGRQELFNNTPAVFKMRGIARFPLLSASMARIGSSLPVFVPYTVVKAGNAVVGIIGVCDSSAGYFPELKRPSDYTVRPLMESVRPILADLARRTDFIVVLAQTEPENAENLLRSFPAIDLVIQGFGNREMDKPRAVGRGFLVAPGDRGQFVGIVKLEKTAGGPSTLKRGDLVPVLGISEDRKATAIVNDYFGTRKTGQ